MMNIHQSTRSYEAWVRSQITVVEADLRHKHAMMTAAIFPFFRATYYHWAGEWAQAAPDAAKAPKVLAVGDLHVENFGTWRDCDGRLVWGTNDFDETWILPYTNDLLRLATSALIAEEEHLSLPPKRACAAILGGYRDCLVQGGEPYVLGERHSWLRAIAESELRNPVRFWAKMDALPSSKSVRRQPSADAVRAIREAMPEKNVPFTVAARCAGLGSLGRQRWVGNANWRGGRLAREAKALLPSANLWAASLPIASSLYQTILNRSVRCPDPFVFVDKRWIVRRLSPHCSRIELTQMPARKDEDALLYSMGWETANVHLGSPRAVAAVLKDLDRRKTTWLRAGAKSLTRLVRKNWQDWRSLH